MSERISLYLSDFTLKTLIEFTLTGRLELAQNAAARLIAILIRDSIMHVPSHPFKRNVRNKKYFHYTCMCMSSIKEV